jgi:hypothetical protein
VKPADAVSADAEPADHGSTDEVVCTAPTPEDAAPADAVPAGTERADQSSAAADAVSAAPAAPAVEHLDQGPADGAADSAAVPPAAAEAGQAAAADDPRLLLARDEKSAEAEGAAGAGVTVPEATRDTGEAASSPAAAAEPRQQAVAAGPQQAAAATTGAPAFPRQPATQPPAAGVSYPHLAQAQPYAVPAPGQAVWAVPPQYAPKERKERPWLRTLGRWATAVGVLAVVGTVTAALVTVPERKDLPGLGTPSDGRWTFPALSLPTLPPGDGPADADAEHVHRVDLRALLLPAPVGATVESGLPGTHGWYPADKLVGLLSASAADPVRKVLQDSGLRHVAAIGWTMPDGTRTEIYLQQFRSVSTIADVDQVESVNGYLAAAPDAGAAGAVNFPDLSSAVVRAAPAGSGHAAVTYGFVPVGDTEMLVVMSSPKQVPVVDFEQVVELENRLLTA